MKLREFFEKNYLQLDEDGFIIKKILKKLEKRFIDADEVLKVIDDWLNKYCSHSKQDYRGVCVECVEELKKKIKEKLQ